MVIDIERIEKKEQEFWDLKHEELYNNDDSTLSQEVENYINRAISPFKGGKDIRFFDHIQFLKNHFEGIEGKRVLEPACGTGVMGCYLGKYRKCFVEGIDISPKSIQIAERRKKLLNLERKINFTVQSFYETNFSDNSFDLVIGNSLHHMHDYNKIGKEMSRILKKGGKAVFIEPYGHNFIFNFVRVHNLFGSGGGSPEEYGNYLTIKKINTLSSYFSKVNCEEFRFFMMAARSLKSLKILKVFYTMDSILRHLPYINIKKYFGFVGIVLIK